MISPEVSLKLRPLPDKKKEICLGVRSLPQIKIHYFIIQCTYSALMDTPGLEDKQMADGSETKLRPLLVYELAGITKLWPDL